jgi:two-component system sensor histidine kinase ResE
VLYNLLDNAIHHTPQDGQVTLRVRSENRHIEVSVHNSGSAIPPEELPRIFERFYRGERSRARSSSGYRGTGLGLAIARGFVEAHGGTITAESDPNSGTTFTFTLP